MRKKSLMRCFSTSARIRLPRSEFSARNSDADHAMSDTDVLIAGAGPTGLVLALWLQRLGVRVRIVDKVAEPGTTSRALVLHDRTMALYQQSGIVEGLAGRG